MNWKDATWVITKHESCDFRKSTAAALANSMDVSDILSKLTATEKQWNRQYFLKVLSSIRFLAGQALPLHGDGDETDFQLLGNRGDDYPKYHQFLER